jgi:hypothetical protein
MWIIEIPGALDQHPSGSLVTAIFFLQKPLHTAIQVQGARHQHLPQIRWWLLPDFGQHPLGGPPVIDVFFNLGGGCCRTSASTPQVDSHRRLPQLR